MSSMMETTCDVCGTNLKELLQKTETDCQNCKIPLMLINGINEIAEKPLTREKRTEEIVTLLEKVEKEQSKNLSGKMEQVAILASGTGYALQKVTNKEPAVTVAYDINMRAESLAGKPDLDAEKEIWKTVDQLMSQVKTEREKGEKALLKKDEEITELQDETKLLLAELAMRDEPIVELRCPVS